MGAITETTVANRGLQHLGATRIAVGAFRTEQSQNAAAMRACYDTLRRAELRRNVWRFAIRKTALRSIDQDTMLVTWPTWAIGTTYAINDIITGSDGQVYISIAAANLANDPIATIGGLFWTLYTGTMTASQYIAAWSGAITYAVNQLSMGSNGVAYISLVNTNLNHNPTSTTGFWAVANTSNANTSYYSGELVYTLTSPVVVYISTVNNNQTNPITDTTGSWYHFTVAPAIALINFIYPIGSGPSWDTFSKNVYQLPNGFLREAPQDPRAGVVAFLGGPAGLFPNDWEYENNYFTTFNPGPIIYRFCADISDPSQFDPMFVEGFGARLGAETCEEITQSDEKLAKCNQIYTKFMSEARTVNGIETGPVEPPIDEYIAVRN